MPRHGKGAQQAAEPYDVDALDRMEVQSQGSALTGSQGSASSLNSTVVRLGTASINSLVWGSSIVYIIGSLAEALALLLNFNMVSRFSGYKGLNALAMVRPLEYLIVRNMHVSMAEAAGARISLFLSKNHQKHAIAYFNHYVFLCGVWCLLVWIAVCPALDKLYAACEGSTGLRDGRTWLKITFSASPLLVPFSLAVGPILEAENRALLGLCRQLVLAVLGVAVDACVCFWYNFPPREHPPAYTMFSNFAISTCVVQLVVSVWMVLVFFRVQVLDLPIRGNTKFSRAGFWPLRWKIFKELLKDGLMAYVEKAVQPLSLLIGIILLPSVYTNATQIYICRCVMATYLVAYTVCSAIPAGFTRGFTSVVTYNIGARNYGRVRNIIAVSVLWQLVVSGIVSIVFAALSGSFFRIFLPPSVLDGGGEVWEAYTSSGSVSYLCAGITAGFMGGFDIVSSLMAAEGRYVLLLLLRLGRFVACFVCIFVTTYMIGDGAKIVYGLALGDAVPIVCGYFYVVYYIYKYNHLSDIEEARKAKNELEAQLEKMEGYDELYDGRPDPGVAADPGNGGEEVGAEYMHSSEAEDGMYQQLALRNS